MTDTENRLPWTAPGWSDQAETWMAARLLEHGIHINGPIEHLHIRPWSVILRIPTQAGFYFFKASAPVLAHEPGLTQALYRWRPDCVQTVIAVDLERAWMLMPDESPMLRALIQSKEDLTHWETILPLYAGLQQAMIPHQAALLASGILDRRLACLPEKFAGLLEDRESLLIDQPDGLTMGQYRQLLALVPRYTEMCARLAAFGLPETLHHDDFHDANVFVPGGRYAFSDWGESCITHPFFTMLVTLRSIAYRFNWPYGAGEHHYQLAPELLHLRDIYLAHWTDYGTPADLQEIFALAWRVAMINRALTWHHVVSHLTQADQAQQAYAVPAWLGEFLDAMAQDPA